MLKENRDVPHSSSHRLPSTIIDIRLQFSCNHGRNALLQPHVPVQRVVTFLIEEELSSSSEAGVRLPKLVEVRCRIEAAVLIVKVEDAAFADNEKQARINPTSVQKRQFH